MRALGRQLDCACAQEEFATSPPHIECAVSRQHAPRETAQARMLLNLHGLSVVYKPPCWVSGTEGDHAVPADPVLSAWLQSELQACEAIAAPCAITRDMTHSFGFVHRLDKPSSGILLATTTFDAYYAISWQLGAGSLCREYSLVLQALGFAELSCVDRRVPHTEEDNVALPRKWATGKGKPSRSATRMVLHFKCSSEGLLLGSEH